MSTFSAPDPQNSNNISVVIPCFNCGSSIDSAVHSALRQYGNDVEPEVICIDDGSTDSTSEKLRRLYSDGAIQLIHNGTSRGACAARNQGMHVATRRYIQFLDGDDILLPGKLLRQSDILDQTHADFLAGAYESQSIGGGRTDRFPHDDLWSGLILSRLGRTSSNLFRRSALIRIGGWNENQKSSQEYELMFRLMKSGGTNSSSVAMDQEIGAHIISTPRSISHSTVDANAMRLIQLRSQMLKYLDDRNELTITRKKALQEIYNNSLSEMSENFRVKIGFLPMTDVDSLHYYEVHYAPHSLC